MKNVYYFIQHQTPQLAQLLAFTTGKHHHGSGDKLPVFYCSFLG
jgi:hypothetical protein